MFKDNQGDVGNNTTASLNPIDTPPAHSSQRNYDALSDTHNVVIGSVALLLAATTIVIAFVLFRLDRRRAPRSNVVPLDDPADSRAVAGANTVQMLDIGSWRQLIPSKLD